MLHLRMSFALLGSVLTVSSVLAQTLPGTKALETKDDLAAVMVEGIDKYLDRQLEASVAGRKQFWQPDYSSAEAYVKSVSPNRERLKKIVGLVDPRLPVPALGFMASTMHPSIVVAETKTYKVYAVRWPVLPGVEGEGLLLEPRSKAKGCVVAIPDADWSPEMLAGLAPGLSPRAQYARLLADNGCRVVVPTLIDRKDTWSGNPRVGRLTNQTHREFIYRMSYEMGRHIIGYEMQRILAVVDWFTRTKEHPPIGVYGCGEGGLLALYCGAVDTRIDVTGVSGYFGPREKLYDEPIYRNVWSLLREFGDGELLQLILPRALIVERAEIKTAPPPAARDGRGGAAPGNPSSPTLADSSKEIRRALAAVPKAFPMRKIRLRPIKETVAADGYHGPGSTTALENYFQDLTKQKEFAHTEVAAKEARKNFDPLARQKRQFDQLVSFTQKLLPASAARRQEFVWSKLDTSSPEKYEKSTQQLRDTFWEEIIGKLPKAGVSMNPRTRLVYDTPRWKGYEVVLDLYEEVICYGILLVPNDIAAGEKRPVIVCQHGLEGKPTDIVNPKEKTRYYNSFGAQLADRGFIVFAPQNPYIFQNKFRQLDRKANPLKLSLYSFIVRQHERILDWLATLPFVDSARIAYYGLSYGGKVAMRIPSILMRYCLSICSGDFNEWIWKNITLDWQNSYMFTVEYEMYEFNLGNTFNYAEMAALIAPRPFMVERGHDDGVGLDEYVAFEYAKVRRLYSRLGRAERTAIEFFPGGHEIHGVGTFAFLHRHLNWPAPK
jgi:cephalosporin-C deacetylase-like acetyl esterase